MMNLFFKLLFKKISSVDKVEQKYNKNKKDYKQLIQIQDSEEFKEYVELKDIIESDEYENKVREIKELNFQDTEQGTQYAEYVKLEKHELIQAYQKLNATELLADYKKYLIRKHVTQLSEIDDSEVDGSYSKFKNFEDSDQFQQYQKACTSEQLKRFNQLCEIVQSEKFIQFKDHMKDDKRWEKSFECKQALRYHFLSNKETIKFYLKEIDNPRLDFFREWEMTFEDEFHGKKLDRTKWVSSLPGAEYVMEQELSYSNERQAYVGEDNLDLDYGVLTILTKFQKKLSNAWHPKQGFVQKEFEYTSGLISTKGLFSQKEGLFEAKIRSRGTLPLHHAFSLVGKQSLPTICIMKTGVRRHYIVGNVYKEGDAVKSYQEVIKGLLFRGGGYFIFSLEWTSSELIWRINNYEVYRSEKNLPVEAQSLMINSFVGSGKGHADGAFDIDWVRVFKKK